MTKLLSIKDILDDKQRAALGDVAAESARLESVVDAAIRVLCGFNDEAFHVVIGVRTIGPKLEVLKVVGEGQLAGRHRKRRRNRFLGIVQNLKGLIGQRNIAIHGTWGPQGGFKPEDLLALMDGSYKAKGAVAKNRKGGSLSADSLEKLAANLTRGTNQLIVFAGERWNGVTE